MSFLARRARYRLLCHRETNALTDAVRAHCLAARDAVAANIASADERAAQFREIHAAASGSVRDVAADWLDRTERLQQHRKLIVDRLHHATIDPAILDDRSGDLVTAAQESLLTCARIGLHPANVAPTARAVVEASDVLLRKMKSVRI